MSDMITNNENVNRYRKSHGFRNFLEIRESPDDLVGTRLFTFLVTGAAILTAFAITWVIW
ncbi:MAG: hypothetical protein M1616_01090 [Candidatus Thermoplasmatota archaeon]|nr:hypothetical protein [Candidatus Thermoplasmatota archaeon]